MTARKGNDIWSNNMKRFLLWVAVSLSMAAFVQANQGVYSKNIVIGGVMDLEGQSRGLGQGMKTGIEAAFRGVTVRGKRLDYKVLNDSYTPDLTARQTERLIEDDVFAMLGNVGTPTAAVSLPLLADAGIPAVGFFTGAGLLRPGVGDVINFRASYVQEAATVISNAVRAGVGANQICAFVQNDAYGMAGVAGIKAALRAQPNTRDIIAKIDEILAMEGDNPNRNNIGPVGVYQRNTLSSRDGYDSLKSWEDSQGTRCKMVVTVGTYAAVGRFAGYVRYQQEDWVISAVSFTGADNFAGVLSEFNVDDRVVMTQVVPELEAKLGIVNDAKKALGDDFNYVTFEGYLAGKMFIKILNAVEGDLNRRNFVRAARNSEFELGGLDLEFIGDNQGSDLVTTTYFSQKEYRPMTNADWLALF
jgi:ABC-type branched-subunit amino acid transport system substrate-binding protein